MSARTRTKSVIIFMVVCYAIAVTVSASFHTHDSSDSCCPVPPRMIGGENGSYKGPPACGCDSDHRHDPRHPTQPTTGDEDHPTGSVPQVNGTHRSHFGPCPVCSFLAQKTITAELPPAIVRTMFEKACDPKLSLAPALLLPHSWHGRAPPLAG